MTATETLSRERGAAQDPASQLLELRNHYRHNPDAAKALLDTVAAWVNDESFAAHAGAEDAAAGFTPSEATEDRTVEAFIEDDPGVTNAPYTQNVLVVTTTRGHDAGGATAFRRTAVFGHNGEAGAAQYGGGVAYVASQAERTVAIVKGSQQATLPPVGYQKQVTAMNQDAGNITTDSLAATTATVSFSSPGSEGPVRTNYNLRPLDLFMPPADQTAQPLKQPYQG